MKSTFRLRPLQGAILLALASASSFSYALRLGEPVVKSYVGQPLIAEFAIEETTPEELRRLQIALANPGLYATMKAAFHPSLKTSSLAIVDRTSLTPKLILRTDGPVEDSVVDIVFELTWAAGRMIQASTVLIDPPPAGVVVEAPVFVPTPVVVVNASTMPVAPSPSLQPALNLPALEKTAPSTVVVQKGDSLSKIATRMNMSGVKLEQLLIALYNKNSKTIASKNMNLIREGTILALPTKQEALAVDASQALKTVALHASNFRSYAQNLAQQSASSALVDKAPRSQTGSLNSEIIERQTAPAVKDQVRIGSGSEGQTSGGRTDKAPEIQFQNAEAESKARQSIVDKNLKDLEELSKLKNAQLAKMQQRATPSGAAPVPMPAASKMGLTPPPEQNSKPMPVAPVSEPIVPTVTTPAAIVKPETILAQESKARSETPKLSATPVPALPKAPNAAVSASSALGSPIIETPTLPDTLRPNSNISGPAGLDNDKPLIDPVKPKPVAVAKPAKPVAPAATPVAPPPESDLIEEWWPMLAGGLGIGALVGGWLYARRKKKIEDDTYVEHVSSSSEELPTSSAMVFPRNEPTFAQEHQEEALEPQESYRMDQAMALHANEPSEEELEAAAFLEDLHVEPEPVVEEFNPVAPAANHYPPNIPLESIPTLEPLRFDSEFSLESEPAQEPEEAPMPSDSKELPSFEFNFNPNENTELEQLTRSLASEMPSLEEPTPESDIAAYPVSLTYDAEEQLGVAKFYLGLQDYRGVWDMVSPLLNHESDEVKAQAHELLGSIPEDKRAEFSSEM